MGDRTDPATDAPPALAEWLRAELDDPGPYELRRLSGGNTNETMLLASPAGRRVLRRPPAASLAPSAHNVEREHRVLRALEGYGVPAPRAEAICEDPGVFDTPFLVMEAIDGVAIDDRLPEGYPDPDASAAAIGGRVVEALAELHSVPWREAGLTDFGRPDGFLERQVERWQKQLERYRVRDLPDHAEVGDWLERNRPPAAEPGIMHGDFHVDNCLLSPSGPIEVRAIIDWEMATIGDPLLDLGLMLAFWGNERPAERAMPAVQGISRTPGSPSRRELAERYAERSGRSVEHVDWYMALAFWKLATIVEGAYAQHVAGNLDTEYARRLEHDVPGLLREAAGFAGLA